MGLRVAGDPSAVYRWTPDEVAAVKACERADELDRADAATRPPKVPPKRVARGAPLTIDQLRQLPQVQMSDAAAAFWGAS